MEETSRQAAWSQELPGDQAMQTPEDVQTMLKLASLGWGSQTDSRGAGLQPQHGTEVPAPGRLGAVPGGDRPGRGVPAGALAGAISLAFDSPTDFDGARLKAQAMAQANGVAVDDSFAEAFPMKATRLVITAHDLTWALHAAVSATGMATSVIACGCEAGIERRLGSDDTPDGRPGVSVLIFSMSGKELAKQVERRVGQCVLTCPTTAVAVNQGSRPAFSTGSHAQ